MTDTVKLLQECNTGIKMGKEALRIVMPHVCSDKLRAILRLSESTHIALGDEIRLRLIELCANTNDPHPIIQRLSSAKICVSLLVCDSDKRIASIMTDGCDMGIKSIYKYLNKYKNASEEAIDLAKRIVASEDCLERELRHFL